MSLNWNFQRGGGFKPQKKPLQEGGGEWMFSGTTQYIWAKTSTNMKVTSYIHMYRILFTVTCTIKSLNRMNSIFFPITENSDFDNLLLSSQGYS